MNAVAEDILRGPTPHLTSVEEYHNSWKNGFLPDRVELINGVIYEMAPIGPEHLGIVNLLVARINKILPDNMSVSSQGPVLMGDFSEPEPDICILNKPVLTLLEMKKLPDAKDVELIIEVSDSTLNHDTGTKAGLYAKNRIPRYWVIDVQNKQLIDHQDPSDTGYGFVESIAIEAETEISLKPQLSLFIGY